MFTKILLLLSFLNLLICEGSYENFDQFYSKFRFDSEFQFSRIEFPLRRITFTDKPDSSYCELFNKYQREINGNIYYPILSMVKEDDFNGIFPTEDVMTGDEIEGSNFVNDSTITSFIRPADGDIALEYKFRFKGNKWFLIEFEDMW